MQGRTPWALGQARTGMAVEAPQHRSGGAAARLGSEETCIARGARVRCDDAIPPGSPQVSRANRPVLSGEYSSARETGEDQFNGIGSIACASVLEIGEHAHHARQPATGSL